MKILFVTPPPYLPNRLHRNRSFDLIRILAKKHDVYLLSVTCEKQEPEEFREIKKVCKSVKIIYLNPIKSILNCLRFPLLPSEVAYCYSEKVEKEIQKIIKSQKIDLVYLKRLRSAIYLSQPESMFEKFNLNLLRHSGKRSASRISNGDKRCWTSQHDDEKNNCQTDSRIPLVMDTTDAMSMFYFRLYKHAEFPKKLFYFLEAIRYKQFEKIIMKKIKNWIVCSPVDQEYLQKFGRDVNIHIVPNPVDTICFSPPKSNYSSSTSKESRSLPRHLRGVANFPPSRWPKDSSKVERRGKQGNSLLFRGLMDKPVNIDACLFFVKEILPRVKKGIKDIRLFIVGPKPHSSIKKLANEKDIFVTGFVEDIRKYIGDTDLSICPVRIASGTRFKITQAWAMGRPVVSTALGAEGLLYRENQNILVADNPREFAQKITSLLKNKKLYDTLAKNGRKTVVSKYSFNVVGQKLETIIGNVKTYK